MTGETVTELTVDLIPLGNTTEREISAMRGNLRQAMLRMRGVAEVTAVQTEAPEGAKGIGEALGALLVGVAPNVVSGVFDTIKAIVGRPGPAMAEVEITAGTVKLKFDPRSVTPADMAAFVERVRPKAGPA